MFDDDQDKEQQRGAEAARNAGPPPERHRRRRSDSKLLETLAVAFLNPRGGLDLVAIRVAIERVSARLVPL